MTLGAPAWLHLLWLAPLLALGAWRSAAMRRRALRGLFGRELAGRLVPPGIERRRAWRTTLSVLGIGLAAVAAAQPRWGYTWRELSTRGVEVIVALDLSRSMEARDVDPSRLERARRELEDLLHELPGDRVGLVVFAGGAYPRVPLTLDHRALLEIARGLDTGVLRAQGSSLAAALDQSLDLFDLDRKVDRGIVVLSDGEAWDRDLDEAAKRVARAGVRVYAMGIGTPQGAPIPEEGGGFKTDRKGQVVVTRLREDALRQLAAATGGAYLRSAGGATGAADLASQLHSALAASATRSHRERVWDERFQWPLGGGIALLLLGALLGDHGRGTGRRAGLASLCVLLAAGAARAAPEQAAPDVQALASARAADPEDPGRLWALAEGLYRAGRHEEARAAFDELARRAPDPESRRRALYDSGNAAYRAGKLEEAVSRWEKVLQEDPDDQDAKANAEAVKREIALRRQQQRQQGDQDDQGGDQGDQGGDQGDQGGDQEGDQRDQEDQDRQAGRQGDQGEQQDQGRQAGQDGDQGDQARADQATQPAGGSQDDGTRQDEKEDAGQGEVALAGDQDQPPPEEAPVQAGVGEMSPDQALRLLEGAEEGTPRVVIRGRPQGKDW